MRLKEQTFFRFFYCLIFFCIFLSFMYLIYYLLYENKFHFYEINEINVNLIGEKVETCGVIDYIRRTEEVLFIKLTNYNHSIDVVDFNFKYLNFSKGDFICVRGVVKQYKGKLEIIAQ